MSSSKMRTSIDLTVLDSSDEEGSIKSMKTTERKSILALIEQLPLKSKLRKLLELSGPPKIVAEMPSLYNGNVSFELPPSRNSGMEGMLRANDCHHWIRYATSTIQGFYGDVRVSSCGGGFQCVNNNCNYLLTSRRRNVNHFAGRLNRRCPLGLVTTSNGSMKCHYCSNAPCCTQQCCARIYYCIPTDTRYSRLVVHSGLHTHDYGTGSSSFLLAEAETLVKNRACENLTLGPKGVQKSLAKDLISMHLIPEAGVKGGISAAKLDELLAQIEPTTNSRRLKKWITEARKELRPIDFSHDITSLLYLKEHCAYDFFHGSLFPGQMHDDNDRCFIFKMSTVGPASGVDLVKRMQPGGDLEKCWCCFDHLFRIKEWITMAAHVYDTRIQSMQTIAICDMKVQDTRAQILFWKLLNRVMSTHVEGEVTFRGFMADEAQANWIAVRTVYGGDPNSPMVGRERSCLFHFMDSVRKRTEKNIKIDSREEHISMCLQWRNSVDKNNADAMFNQIASWWKLGHAYDGCIKELESWLTWWKNRTHRWGKFVVTMMDIEDEANVPTTNLSEVVHSVWQRVDLYSNPLSLYEASVGDLANSILQSAREKSFLSGHYIGSGPSLQNLMERIRSGRRSSIVGTSFLDSVRSFVETIDLTSSKRSFVDVEHISRKRPVSEWNNEHENVAHRPDVEYVRKAHKQNTFPQGSHKVRHVHVGDSIDTDNLQLASNVKENSLHDTMWAIRRIGQGRNIKCQGMNAVGRGRCNKSIVAGVGASFFGTRNHCHGSTNQFMWFCPADVRCTWKVNKNIINPPIPVKDFWLVQKGTCLTQAEVDVLNRGGYILNSLNNASTNVHAAEHNRTTASSYQNNPAPPSVASSSIKRGRMRHRYGVSMAAKQRMEKGIFLNGCLRDVIKHPSEQKEIYVIESFESSITGKRYQVTIAAEPICTCEDFTRHISSGKYIACKHLYFVFLKVKGLDVDENMFIHQPVLTPEELFHVFASPNSW